VQVLVPAPGPLLQKESAKRQEEFATKLHKVRVHRFEISFATMAEKLAINDDLPASHIWIAGSWIFSEDALALAARCGGGHRAEARRCSVTNATA
jgi:hypothetical protein